MWDSMPSITIKSLLDQITVTGSAFAFAPFIGICIALIIGGAAIDVIWKYLPKSKES